MKNSLFLKTAHDALTAMRKMEHKTAASLPLYIVTFLTGLIVFPDVARAQSLGNIFCSAAENIAPFESLFVGLAYVTGAILIGSGLYQLSYFTDSINAARQFGISRPKGYMVAGACLLALPAFIRFMVNTVFNFSFQYDFGGGLHACVPIIGEAGTGHGFGTEVGLDGLMLNVVYNIKSPMVFFLSALSIIMGIFLVFRGLVKASKFGQERATSIPQILGHVFIGTILYTVGTSMNMIMSTVFGDGNIFGSNTVLSAISTDVAGNTQPFQNAVYAALTFFQLIGMIAFIRGWLILKDSVDHSGQGNKLAQGLTHIVGGVLAVNIYRFLEVMDTTFGTGFL
jgi:intracellular multiplication protein IcmC